MRIEFAPIAEYLGELCGAAYADWVSAEPGEVGLHGIPIKQWRDAYFEGCKDMAEGVAARLPEEYREEFKRVAQSAFTKAFEAAKAQSASEKE